LRARATWTASTSSHALQERRSNPLHPC
jgi:hypothetical protein